MKTILKTAVLGSALVLTFMGDLSPNAPLGFQLVPDAQAIFGVWRRAARRTVIIGSAAAATEYTASAEMAEANQQKAAAAATPAAPPPEATGKPLPLGTVVSSLPGGCTSTPVGGKNYYYCGGNFYRAVFQGNSLVYVTAKP